jgi:cytochrome P450
MEDTTNSSVLKYGLAVILVFVVVKMSNARKPNLDGIPAIGPSGLISSYIGAIRFLHNAVDIVQEGYEKYRGGFFKVATLDKWVVVVSGPRFIEDIRSAPSDQLSLHHFLREAFQSRYTIGPAIAQNPFHVTIIRNILTRNLGVRFADIQDEVVVAFDDNIPLQHGEWTSMPAMRTITQIVCRIHSRLSVGLPLCRDPDYVDIFKQFTGSVANNAAIINLFPSFLRPIAGRIFTPAPSSIRRALKSLGPMIQDRLDKEKEYGGDWPGKPNDLITWILVEAKGQERTPRSVVLRLFAVNFAANHTTTIAFVFGLFRLAEHPEYAQPMREEVESAIMEDGWTKGAIGKMFKVDSFLKEVQRMHGNGCFGLSRKVLKDFTFSDGTMLPAGTVMQVPKTAMHLDAANYANPDVFDGFRYANLRDGDNENTRSHFIVPNVDYIAFGYGKQSCPGRFLAGNVLKTMMAHVLLKYDIKFEDGATKPQTKWFAAYATPDTRCRVMFRERRS